MRTIVWIDPDTDVLDPLVRPLVTAGYQIMRLHTVNEALKSIEQIRRADLLLISCNTPAGTLQSPFSQYTGKDLISEIRLARHIQVPIIALTSARQFKEAEELKKVGVFAVLRIPVLPSVLKNCVEQALRIAI